MSDPRETEHPVAHAVRFLGFWICIPLAFAGLIARAFDRDGFGLAAIIATLFAGAITGYIIGDRDE